MERHLALAKNVENLPAIVAASGSRAGETFLEFFFATIRNKNTRAAYAHAVIPFLDFLELRNVHDLTQIRPLMVAAYIEQHLGSKQTVKQHLAAIRRLFDYLVVKQVLESNPASSVKGPKFSITRGKTPVLSAQEARQLLDSIDVSTKLGVRDRALIGVMMYSFARISAVLDMNLEDYFIEGKRSFLRLNEKGGKQHVVPVHHNAEAYLDAYIIEWELNDEQTDALWRTKNGNRLLRQEALKMVKRRAMKAGLSPLIGNHTFRATGITAFLENNGTLEKAQQIAAHASTRTTKLYDRRDDQLSLDEIERIQI